MENNTKHEQRRQTISISIGGGGGGIGGLDVLGGALAIASLVATFFTINKLREGRHVNKNLTTPTNDSSQGSMEIECFTKDDEEEEGTAQCRLVASSAWQTNMDNNCSEEHFLEKVGDGSMGELPENSSPKLEETNDGLEKLEKEDKIVQTDKHDRDSNLTRTRSSSTPNLDFAHSHAASLFGPRVSNK
ncbi:Hypothetical predicted protein [Prunus dulcis]|uniref:Uncharacterized protein n=1 Tax=Prunus dulcis TaxID=3755 RepID=A0A5E4FAW2_PRUDU|nr:Hypothetical predicted protein [Prunus dulcis]